MACNPVKKPGPWAVARLKVVTPSPAIPIRNLMNCAAQPFRWRQQEELEMNPKRSKSRHGRKMPMVHPNAAAIDVGATMHMAAVRADRTPEPVRSFGEAQQ